MLLDAGGIIRWCSETARQLLARPPHAVIGRPIAEFIPLLALNPDTPGYNAAYVVFSFGEDQLRACRVLDGCADAFDADVAVSLVRLGDTRAFLVALHRGCDPLLVRLDMQRCIESVARDIDPILVVDDRGFVTHANPAFEARTGFLLVEVLGVHADTLTSDRGDGRFAQRSGTLEHGRLAYDTTTLLRRDGTRMRVDETLRPFVDALGRTTHYVLHLRDADDHMARHHAAPSFSGSQAY